MPSRFEAGVQSQLVMEAQAEPLVQSGGTASPHSREQFQAQADSPSQVRSHEQPQAPSPAQNLQPAQAAFPVHAPIQLLQNLPKQAQGHAQSHGQVRSTPVENFAQWRSAARLLLACDIAPHRVRWITPDASPDLLDDAIELDLAATEARASLAEPLHLPRELLDMLQSAACFRAPDRWAFLYCVVWRWRAGEREVMSIADPDGHRLRSMVKSVRREEHDMHAYVRFRERAPGAGAPRFVAWFEPSHDVLPQVARHFAKRMGNASWIIATPAATVLWDGMEVRFTGPMARNGALIEDTGEQLWLTYYASIFNPARLNTTVMHSHIPGRFWKNLPEGKIVPALVSQAANGGRRDGQAQGVSKQEGKAVNVSAEQAAPRRAPLAPVSLPVESDHDTA